MFATSRRYLPLPARRLTEVGVQDRHLEKEIGLRCVGHRHPDAGLEDGVGEVRGDFVAHSAGKQGLLIDLHRDPWLTTSRRAVITAGHDEYWSMGMRDAVEGFLADGGNAAFLSGWDITDPEAPVQIPAVQEEGTHYEGLDVLVAAAALALSPAALASPASPAFPAALAPAEPVSDISSNL